MAGNIEIDTARLTLDSSASISSTSNSEFFGGDAGTITVKTGDSVRLLGNSSLTTEAKGAGGGKIDVSAGNEIYLFNGKITSSVKQGKAKAGMLLRIQNMSSRIRGISPPMPKKEMAGQSSSILTPLSNQQTAK
ncbi:MAG: hypothetical protein GY795_31705 [Desulfobacterales bacterium]|nr:hypothetical protein [Desulfobacterales bacterium]